MLLHMYQIFCSLLRHLHFCVHFLFTFALVLEAATEIERLGLTMVDQLVIEKGQQPNGIYYVLMHLAHIHNYHGFIMNKGKKSTGYSAIGEETGIDNGRPTGV